MSAVNNFATHILSSSSKRSFQESRKTQTLSINFSPTFTIHNIPKTPSRTSLVCSINAVTEDKEAEANQENEKKESNGTEIEEKIKNSFLYILLDKDRFFNASIVLGAGTLAVTRLLTIDHEYWHVSSIILILFAFGYFISGKEKKRGGGVPPCVISELELGFEVYVFVCLCLLVSGFVIKYVLSRFDLT